jgi:hypothetical protein
MQNVLAMFASGVVIAGCASGVHPSLVPYVAHPPSLEKSETAVLISMDRQRVPHFLGTITKIDGQDVSCHWNYGCPIWARLTSGDHEVTVRYQTDLVIAVSPTQASTRLKYVDLPIRVHAMKPTHVYVIRYALDESGKGVSTRVEDMGERPRSGVLWPIGASNATEYFAEF